MQVARWIIPVVIVSVLAAIVTTWCILPSDWRRPRTITASHRDEMTAAEFFQQARHLLRSSPSSRDDSSLQERADSLLQMAVARQAEHPQEIPAAWDQMQLLLQELPTEASDPVKASSARLLLCDQYEGGLQEATLACKSQADLELVWQIRQQATQEIARLRDELAKHMQARVQLQAEQGANDTFEDRLRSFVDLKQEMDNPLLTLVATVNESSPQEPLREILDHAQSYVKLASERIASREKEVERLEAQLRDGGDPLNPSLQENQEVGSYQPGPCQLCNENLQSLADSLADADLASWFQLKTALQLAEDDERSEPLASPTLEELAGEIDRISFKLHGLQHLAYNLWALREIQSADEIANNWDVRLAPIDAGLLHPTVAALYSRAYDNRMSNINRPEERSAKARYVLTEPKVDLRAF